MHDSENQTAPAVTNLMDQLALQKPELTRAFRQIAQFVLDDPNNFLSMSTRQIAELVSVSEPTLVRFSREFNYKGVSDFRLALAMAVGSERSQTQSMVEPDIQQKLEKHALAKRQIAIAAQTLISTDRSILLDSGSTALRFSSLLTTAQPLTILTTGLHALLELKDAEQHSLILPGGQLRTESMSLSGRLPEQVLSEMTFDTAYIGVDSIDTKVGLSTYRENEAHLTRAMVKAANRVVVLADASKFISPALHTICRLDEIDIIVTDASIAQDAHDAIVDSGTELVIAPETPTLLPRGHT